MVALLYLLGQADFCCTAQVSVILFVCGPPPSFTPVKDCCCSRQQQLLIAVRLPIAVCFVVGYDDDIGKLCGCLWALFFVCMVLV